MKSFFVIFLAIISNVCTSSSVNQPTPSAPLPKNRPVSVPTLSSSTESPRQILKKSIENYLNAGSIVGSGQTTRKYNETEEKKVSYDFTLNSEGDFWVDWQSSNGGPKKIFISKNKSYGINDNAREFDLTDEENAISFFQKETGSNFIIGGILFSDEKDFFLSDKMLLSFKNSEFLNGEENYVISLTPDNKEIRSGLERTIWISKEKLLISKYELVSCSKGNCIIESEIYNYLSVQDKN